MAALVTMGYEGVSPGMFWKRYQKEFGKLQRLSGVKKQAALLLPRPGLLEQADGRRRKPDALPAPPGAPSHPQPLLEQQQQQQQGGGRGRGEAEAELEAEAEMHNGVASLPPPPRPSVPRP